MRESLSLFRSAVARKAWMAATGVLLFGFVVGHLVGNLKLYQGRYLDGPHAGEWKIDVYGEALRELGAPIFGHGQFLWLFRIVLLAAVGLHIWAAVTVTLRNRAARPVRYAKWQAVDSDYAARTMRWGGFILALFVLFHLADLTWGSANPAFVPGSVHANLVASFQRPLVAGLYVVANLALGLHLFHGLWSFFQSLGLNNARWNRARRLFATVAALAITAGNVSFPIAVLTGVVR